ncbi:hypothetical protein [Moraxella porci]|uniref:hypothetical protein n=1 Tax=Moraxella porci TaxID=1288392 RepID=UPI00244A8295|nr:hypothetical protein [Moraxella porci]MDH2274249.1 hypothetical protein [Moraxella porci]
MNLYLKNVIGILALVILFGLGMYLCNTVIDLDKQNRLLEIKLADQVKINEELRSENDLLIEENNLWQLHDEITCDDAMKTAPSMTAGAIKAIYHY